MDINSIHILVLNLAPNPKIEFHHISSLTGKKSTSTLFMPNPEISLKVTITSQYLT